LTKGHLFNAKYLFLSTVTIGVLQTCEFLYVIYPPFFYIALIY